MNISKQVSLFTNRAVAATIVSLALLAAPAGFAFASVTTTLSPTGNGNFSSWDGYSNDVNDSDPVDCEDSSADGNDNVSTSVVNERESVNLNESSIPNGSTITGVEVFVWDQAPTTAGGTYQTFVHNDDTNITTNSGVDLATTGTGVCTAKSQVIDVADFVKDSGTDLEIGVLKTATNGSKVWIGAIRAIVTYTPITIIASSGVGGSITPSGALEVDEGDDYPYTMAPSATYIIDDVEVDSVSSGRLNEYEFANVAVSHTIGATFEGGWTAPSVNSDNSSVSNPDTL